MKFIILLILALVNFILGKKFISKSPIKIEIFLNCKRDCYYDPFHNKCMARGQAVCRLYDQKECLLKSARCKWRGNSCLVKQNKCGISCQRKNAISDKCI